MENGCIPNEDIWASSRKTSRSIASNGRLILKRGEISGGSWTADKLDQIPWLTIRLSKDEPYTITGVATQGENGKNEWVKSYKLRYQAFVGDSVRYYKEQVDNEDVNGTVKVS